MDSARRCASVGQQSCRRNRSYRRLTAASCTLLAVIPLTEVTGKQKRRLSSAFSTNLVHAPVVTVNSVRRDHREVARLTTHQLGPCRGQRHVSGICRAAEDPGRPAEAGLARLQEFFDEAQEVWVLLADARWLDPRSIVERRTVIMAASRVAEVCTVILACLLGLQKVSMSLRLAEGLSPIPGGNILVEQSGKLIPLVSGIIWPQVQLSMLVLTGVSISVFIAEQLQQGVLQVMGVDVEEQRRRRLTVVVLFMFCLVLTLTPPLPDYDVWDLP